MIEQNRPPLECPVCLYKEDDAIDLFSHMMTSHEKKEIVRDTIYHILVYEREREREREFPSIFTTEIHLDY